MSRTDAHLPFHVRFADRRLAIEHHDHRDGPCTLPDLEDVIHGRVNSWQSRGCGWELPVGELVEHPTCGCSLCTGRFDRRAERRRGRREAREEIRKALVDLDADVSGAVWEGDDA